MGEKNMIEDTLFQIKNLEESLKKNAQGILSSTMRKEINSLVKESLMEQEEVVEPEMSPEDVATEDPAMMSDETGMEMDPSMVAAEPAFEDPEMMGDESLPGMETGDDETIDMRDASDAEVIRVIKAIGDNEGVVVTRDKNIITLTDDDDEYIIKLNESMENFGETAFDSELEEMYEDGTELNEFEYEEEDEDMDFGYEDEEDEDDKWNAPSPDDDYEDYEDDKWNAPSPDDDMSAYKTKYRYSDEEDGDMGYEDEEDEDMDFGYEDEDDEDMEDDEEVEGVMYEIEMNEESMDDIEMMEMDDIDMMEMDDMEDDEMFGDFDIEDYESDDEEEDDDLGIYESKKTKKSSKGLTGKGPKFKYGQVTDYKMPKQKEGTKGVGMGKAKFTYKDGENLDGEFRPIKRGKKVETKEASRTYGSGRSFGRGLPKPKAAPRHLKEEVIELRTKNDEYRKALDLFRTKLNEVAVFNSNLAYATRLFTEHSTTKQEKINILRRFDDVETLKESKNLYRVVKSELSNNSLNEGGSLNESIERTVNKTASSGSAVSLIESKTYENPQFLRMKDLMGKL